MKQTATNAINLFMKNEARTGWTEIAEKADYVDNGADDTWDATIIFSDQPMIFKR